MRAVVVGSYGCAEEVLELVNDAPVPQPEPDEILVRVHATSINSVDCSARSGYGRNVFSTLWGELPLILGRDVCGTVEATGTEVSRFQPGDEIYAAPHIGCYAEYVTVKAEHAARKPASLTHLEAASLPFVALTAWTALVEHAGLTPDNCAGKRVVIPRAAGGVGSFAIQLMKAWGAYVIGICSSRNVDLVKRLGADEVIDYTRQDFTQVLSHCDVALDTVGKPEDFESMNGRQANAGSPENYDEKIMSILKTDADAVYVTICSPRMVLTDRYGLEEGTRRAEEIFKERAAAQAELGRRYYWSFCMPSGKALEEIAGLIDSGDIRPVVDRVFPLDDIAAAHNYCESGRVQGKIVINVNAE